MAEDEDPNIISRIERKKANSKKQNRDMLVGSSKYAVGGESTEVPGSTVGENDDSDHVREYSKSTRKKK